MTRQSPDASTAPVDTSAVDEAGYAKDANTKTNVEVTPTPKAFRNMLSCDTGMDMYEDTLPTPLPLNHAGRRLTWAEMESLEEDEPLQMVSSLSCGDEPRTSSKSPTKRADEPVIEKARHNLPRGKMIGALGCGSRADLCAQPARSQSKEMTGGALPGRSASKQMTGKAPSKLAAVTEHQTFVDTDVPDNGVSMGGRSSSKALGFKEALQLMFHVGDPATATEG
jgi:hypothetical protein